MLEGHVADSGPACPPASPEPFLQSCSPAGPQPVLVHQVIPPEGQELTFSCVELNEIPIFPFLQPVNVPQMAAQPPGVSATPSFVPPASHISSLLSL